MIFYFIGVILAITSLVFNNIPALFIGLLVTSLAMLDERNRK
jgi:Na+/H+ antiporter NhaD/arsenite permease-like protein